MTKNINKGKWLKENRIKRREKKNKVHVFDEYKGVYKLYRKNRDIKKRDEFRSEFLQKLKSERLEEIKRQMQN